MTAQDDTEDILKLVGSSALFNTQELDMSEVEMWNDELYFHNGVINKYCCAFDITSEDSDSDCQDNDSDCQDNDSDGQNLNSYEGQQEAVDNNVSVHYTIPRGSNEYAKDNTGMCECTLIQSFEDLNAAKSLLNDNHFPQCVFQCTQSVEKSIKSMCSLFGVYDELYLKKHCNVDMFRHLANVIQSQDCEVDDDVHKLKPLCERFESIGADSWTFQYPLSMRSRYFNQVSISST